MDLANGRSWGGRRICAQITRYGLDRRSRVDVVSSKPMEHFRRQSAYADVVSQWVSNSALSLKIHPSVKVNAIVKDGFKEGREIGLQRD